MRVQKCKGTRDMSPAEMNRFRLIEGIFRDCCIKGGYQEIRTPTLEYLHLFTSTGTLTPGKLGKVYSFLDWDGWSGERVVLRPDATIPVARSYIDTSKASELAKLFYVTNVFIFEETGKENRGIWQCGVELIGAGSAVADVELITLALDVLGKLDLKDVELKLSHSGLIRALLTRFGLSPREQVAVFDRILDGDKDALSSLMTKTPELGETLTPLLDLKGQSPGFLRNLRSLFSRDLPEFEPALNNFIEIADILENMGYRYQIDITSGRGFEYYTGIIFEILAGEERVAGGGRYDDLIPLMGGPQVPASGFALGIDHLMGLISLDTLNGHLPERVLVRTVNSNVDDIRESFRVSACLRDAGYAAELDLGKEAAADLRWAVDVRSKPPRFSVTDLISRKTSEVNSADQVVELLGGDGAD
ncbi:MAG TPA: ATP phosphoribosyltransferase regulatory subunit [Dehalococcoidia bacterium]|nr:ATP phosphoribosyltransferase regulatory subunit [Dehalococcoidia bacterium]